MLKVYINSEIERHTKVRTCVPSLLVRDDGTTATSQLSYYASTYKEARNMARMTDGDWSRDKKSGTWGPVYN